MSNIEIVTVGDELIEGRLVDTNTAHLSRELIVSGLWVARHTSVGDDRARLIDVLREAAGRSDAVIVTGGLGPTTDDLTAECAAEAFGWPIERNAEALAHTRAFFAARGREMSPNNEKQADLPRGSRILPNPQGTAVGFSMEVGHSRLYFMPGVPREMEGMFRDSVLPDLCRALPSEPAQVATLRIFGTGESNVGQTLMSMEQETPPGMSLTIQYRASFPEIQVRLLLRGRTGQEADTVAAMVAEATRRLERFVISTKVGGVGPGLPEAVLDEARQRGLTIAVAESCTGGGVGELLTSIPGSSDVFLGGVIAYANAAKTSLLGVAEALLAEHGAVSGPVAEAMAAGARERLGADLAVAVTGVAGPGGGTPSKPVGTVWIGVASARGVSSRTYHFPYDRERIRTVAAWSATTLLRREIASLQA